MRCTTVAALVVVLTIPTPALHAQQLKASEEASLSQTVDGTKIGIDYSRPRARGRTGLFGSRIHWGEVWTPGANVATMLTVSNDVTIDGNKVPKGKYSVWMIAEHGPWTLVLDPDTTLFHTQHPSERAQQLRFAIKRENRPFMEVLTWWFPEVRSTGATLAMQWDTVYVPLKIDVPPSYTTAIEPAAARRISGTYQMHMEPPPPGADPEEEQPPEQIKFTIRQEGNQLRGTMEPPLYTTESGYRDWVLIPKKGSWYTLGRYDRGELVEIFDFLQIQFNDKGERAQSFEVRLPNDMLAAKATRIN